MNCGNCIAINYQPLHCIFVSIHFQTYQLESRCNRIETIWPYRTNCWSCMCVCLFGVYVLCMEWVQTSKTFSLVNWIERWTVPACFFFCWQINHFILACYFCICFLNVTNRRVSRHIYGETVWSVYVWNSEQQKSSTRLCMETNEIHVFDEQKEKQS